MVVLSFFKLFFLLCSTMPTSSPSSSTLISLILFILQLVYSFSIPFILLSYSTYTLSLHPFFHFPLFLFFHETKYTLPDKYLLPSSPYPQVLDKYPLDSIRYYLCASVTYGADLSFSEASLITMHNSELADILGNLVHR